jgi:hypothetical protein
MEIIKTTAARQRGERFGRLSPRCVVGRDRRTRRPLTFFLSVSVAMKCIQLIIGGPLLLFAKEIEPTKEWQLLGENDTIPAGMHVRMDLTTGEKWVKLNDDDELDNNQVGSTSHEISSASTSSVSMAVIQEDGKVQMEQTSSSISSATSSFTSGSNNHDFDMMHRTLSKLPPEEQERMGGLPELPDNDSTSKKNTGVPTKKQREMFEKRMLEIWQRRQEELAKLQDSIVELPDLLKERIRSIDSYLKDPAAGRRKINLDAQDVPEGVVTDLRSVLEDLEFHLTDVDMARDFHTMGGWSLLTSLLVESSHTSKDEQKSNETASDEIETDMGSTSSTDDQSKIIKIQSLAAWCMGTAVKNTGEFSPYAIEPTLIINKDPATTEPIQTTPIDILIDVFCETGRDDANLSWEARNLLTKTIYAIGSMLRGNRPAQSHAARTNDDLERLGKRYNSLVTSDGQGGYTVKSADIKLLTRLATLSSDIVEDVVLHPSLSDEKADRLIIDKMSSDDWCNATCHVFLSDSFLPMNAQETMIRSVTVLAPFCDWNCDSKSLHDALEQIRTGWLQSQDDFDSDHFEEMQTMIQGALAAIKK